MKIRGKWLSIAFVGAMVAIAAILTAVVTFGYHAIGKPTPEEAEEEQEGAFV